MKIENVLAAILAGGTYLVFAVCSNWVFRRPRTFPRDLGVLALGAVGCGVWETWAVAEADQIGLVRGAIGLGLYVAALGLFVVCARVHRARPLALAFVPMTPEHVVTTGPYRWVRHPFYSAYLLSYAAGPVLTGHLPLWMCVVAMAWVYGRAARREEQGFLKGPLAPTYAAYAARTGMFVPVPWKAWAA